MLTAARPGVLRVESSLGRGSAVIIRFDRANRRATIATRGSLVVDAENIAVVDHQLNRFRTVTFVRSDSGLNLAILEVCCPISWSALPFETQTSVRIGDALVAMGHRTDSDGLASSAVGIVRNVYGDTIGGLTRIELDTGHDAGFDGGPVLSLYGTVVGVNIESGRIIESEALLLDRLLNPTPTPVPPELRISGYLNDVFVTQEARLIAGLVTLTCPR